MAAEGGASSWHHELSPSDPQLTHIQPRSAQLSPIKPPPLLAAAGDDTVVYSALSRPLPDYALTHVFSRVGTGRAGGWV